VERQSSWHCARERIQNYERRSPENSALYRIVFNYRDKLSWEWEQRFQQEYGALRDEVLEAFDKYLDCGILDNGCARARCPSCNHSRLVAFSCKVRGLCPSCSAKRAVLFAEHLHNNVLGAVPIRHVVASIPKRIRCFFRYDRSRHQILFDAVWHTLKQFYETASPEGRAGAVLALHTAGDAANHNPHNHGIVADGVFLPDGSFQQLPKPGTEKLSKLFASKVLSALKDTGLIDDKVISQIMSQKHSGFSLWLGDVIEADDAQARLFLARYIERGPVANEKIEIVDDIITYHHDSEHLPTAEFSPLEFLAAISAQIPDKWEQLVRYLGYFSSRARGARNKKLNEDSSSENSPEILALPDPEQHHVISKSWAALIKRIYNVDPLVCPKCGDTMKIIAFLQDHQEIKKIMKNRYLEPRQKLLRTTLTNHTWRHAKMLHK
jgi:hypothetical protein